MSAPFAIDPKRRDERRMMAFELLKLMLENGGDKRDKVRAAVEYVDLLLAELAR